METNHAHFKQMYMYMCEREGGGSIRQIVELNKESDSYREILLCVFNVYT